MQFYGQSQVQGQYRRYKPVKIFWGDRQETFIKTAVSTNRDIPGNRDLLKVVRERTQSLLRSCYQQIAVRPC